MNYIQISGGIKPDYRTFAGKEIKKRAIKTMSAIPFETRHTNLPIEFRFLRIKDILMFRNINLN